MRTSTFVIVGAAVMAALAVPPTAAVAEPSLGRAEGATVTRTVRDLSQVEPSRKMKAYLSSLAPSERRLTRQRSLPARETSVSSVRLVSRTAAASCWAAWYSRTIEAPAGNDIQKFGHSMRWCYSSAGYFYSIERYDSWGEGRWGWEYLGQLSSDKGVYDGEARTQRKVQFNFIPNGDRENRCLRGDGHKDGGYDSTVTCDIAKDG